MKTAVEKLKELIEKDVKDNGLEYMHFSLNYPGATSEQVAQEILDILDAEKKGLCTEWYDY